MVDAVAVAASRPDARSWPGDIALIIGAVSVLRLVTQGADPIPLSVDEAQYWIWAQQPALGYYSKPPLIAWLIAATTSICGDGESCVRLSAPILHGLTAALLFLLGRTFFDRATGWWCAFVYLLMPGVSVSARVMSTDVPLLVFWTLALICAVRAFETGRTRWWALLGLTVGLGLMSKYAMALFIPCAGIYVVWSRTARNQVSYRGVMIAGVIAAAVIAPNLAWNINNDLPSLRHAATNLANQGASLDVGRSFEFLGAQFLVFGPISFAAMMAGAWCYGRGRPPADDKTKLLLSFSIPIIAALTIEAFFARAHANWAATAYIAGTVLTVRWAMEVAPVLLKAASVVNIALAAVIMAPGPILSALSVDLPAKFDLAWRERGWDQIGLWLIDLRSRYPNAVFLFDTRQAMAASIYYARPQLDNSVIWNPTNTIHNHFEMTTGPLQYPRADFIYVTREPTAAWVKDAFTEIELLPSLSIATHPDRQLDLQAYLVKGFKGYPQ
ncbi:MAG: phospholipid carrier-dependent glycosyltransferase [Alphaproteobacteria bacterium]|nr:phospholipid carrier-dependent glycosyltransferase [Alphaproteobacteria bacterium]